MNPDSSVRRSVLARVIRPLALAFLMVLLVGGLGSIALGVNDAINRHHDRVALKGLDNQAEPIDITIEMTDLVVPANLIRFPTDRRGGLVTAVDLLLLWPTLDGFSEERAREFRDDAPRSPLIFVTITEAQTPLDSTARLDDIYSRHFVGRPFSGPGHLIGRHMDSASPYRGEVIYYQPRVEEPYVVRCLAEETEDIPATCLREVNIGHGLTMLYRFDPTWLGEWPTMDKRLREIAAGLIRTS